VLLKPFFFSSCRVDFSYPVHAIVLIYLITCILPQRAPFLFVYMSCIFPPQSDILLHNTYYYYLHQIFIDNIVQFLFYYQLYE
jgi:hypothetical protein